MIQKGVSCSRRDVAHPLHHVFKSVECTQNGTLPCKNAASRSECLRPMTTLSQDYSIRRCTPQALDPQPLFLYPLNKTTRICESWVRPWCVCMRLFLFQPPSVASKPQLLLAAPALFVRSWRASIQRVVGSKADSLARACSGNPCTTGCRVQGFGQDFGV